jgi:hypothetical protein
VAGVKSLTGFGAVQNIGGDFCEKSVTNEKCKIHYNFKCRIVSELRGKSGAGKYRPIAPTLGVDNAAFYIRIRCVDGRKAWQQLCSQAKYAE